MVKRQLLRNPPPWTLKPTSADYPASFNLEELRSSLGKYLDNFQKENEGLTFRDRPLGLNKLVVVAFVQDDATQEVLQAVQAEVK